MPAGLVWPSSPDETNRTLSHPHFPSLVSSNNPSKRRPRAIANFKQTRDKVKHREKLGETCFKEWTSCLLYTTMYPGINPCLIFTISSSPPVSVLKGCTSSQTISYLMTVGGRGSMLYPRQPLTVSTMSRSYLKGCYNALYFRPRPSI